MRKGVTGASVGGKGVDSSTLRLPQCVAFAHEWVRELRKAQRVFFFFVEGGEVEAQGRCGKRSEEKEGKQI